MDFHKLTLTLPEVEALYGLVKTHEAALGDFYSEIMWKLAFVLVKSNWDPSKSKDPRCEGCCNSCSECSVFVASVAAFIARIR